MTKDQDAPLDSSTETEGLAPIGAIGPVKSRRNPGWFKRGNTDAVVASEHHAAFWAAHEQARRDIVSAIAVDQGHTADDAPRALLIAAEGVAQATLLRDSAFARMMESGGPLTAKGRARRAFTVWEKAIDRLERHLRLVGLRRINPRRTGNIAEQLAQQHPRGGQR